MISDEKLARELRSVWVPDPDSSRSGPYPDDWIATARRAKQLLPATTGAEEELIAAAWSHDEAALWQGIASPKLLAAVKELRRSERRPQPRWIAWEFGIKDTRSGVVWTPLTFEANNGGGVSLRDATLAALNAQPPG